MSYFDLLCTRKYFDVFLDYFNHSYDQVGQHREKHYSELINRYRLGTTPFLALINRNDHVDDVYQALAKEFGMARVRLASLEEFRKSVREQKHQQMLARLASHKIDDFSNYKSLPGPLLADLEQIFKGLTVTQPQVKSKLVAVSKTLHFLLPDLVMPVDNAIVLRFFGIKNIPEDVGKQFDLFIEVFEKYLELAARLGLKQSNSDGNWWNISVPKRIDNAIAGFWFIFGDESMKYLRLHHTDQLLEKLRPYLEERLTSASRSPKVKWEDIETFIKANPSGSAEMMKQSGSSYADTYKYMKKAGLAQDEIDRILRKVYSNSKQ